MAHSIPSRGLGVPPGGQSWLSGQAAVRLGEWENGSPSGLVCCPREEDECEFSAWLVWV